jgi:hypothetical protein
MHNRFRLTALIAGTLAVGALLTQCARPATTGAVVPQGDRIFEIRTYTTADGKLEALKSRFRDHTMQIFERHGMTNVGYWTPTDGPLSQNTLVYVLAYPSREAATASWAAFRADPEWQRVRAESEANGPIVLKVESVFVRPTDFSPMK